MITVAFSPKARPEKPPAAKTEGAIALLQGDVERNSLLTT